MSVELGKILHEGGARSNLGVMGILIGITAVEDEVFQMTDLIKLNIGHQRWFPNTNPVLTHRNDSGRKGDDGRQGT